MYLYWDDIGVVNIKHIRDLNISDLFYIKTVID